MNYRLGWRPDDQDRLGEFEEGRIVAWERKPWRVIDVRDANHREGEPTYQKYMYIRLRPVDITDDLTSAEAHLVDVRLRGPRRATDGLFVLRDHYGLCVHCNELMPCHELTAQWSTEHEIKTMTRYETAGVCPGCLEVVTHRQASETFPNVVVPLGPPVTFHAGRKSCRYAMEQYRERANQPASQLRLDGGAS